MKKLCSNQKNFQKEIKAMQKKHKECIEIYAKKIYWVVNIKLHTNIKVTKRWKEKMNWMVA